MKIDVNKNNYILSKDLTPSKRIEMSLNQLTKEIVKANENLLRFEAELRDIRGQVYLIKSILKPKKTRKKAKKGLFKFL